MRVAALYDIHGNLPALEAVLRDVRGSGADHVVVGGDVLPGPMPVETLDVLTSLNLPATFIRGNGETAVLAERAGRDSGAPASYRPSLQWVASQLTPERSHWLAQWPPTARIGDVLFCHATPRNENEIFVRTTPEETLAPIFEAAGAATVVYGHTHMQFDRRIGSVRVINAGSVGMPVGAAGACWLLLDDAPRLRRTTYDLDAAAARLSATAYPDVAQFCAQYVTGRPSEEQMLAVYARVEITEVG